jgi:hypothetical protein
MISDGGCLSWLRFAICAGGAGLWPAASASLPTFFGVRRGTATGGHRCGPEAHATSTIGECPRMPPETRQEQPGQPAHRRREKAAGLENHQPCATLPERAASNPQAETLLRASGGSRAGRVILKGAANLRNGSLLKPCGAAGSLMQQGERL